MKPKLNEYWGGQKSMNFHFLQLLLNVNYIHARVRIYVAEMRSPLNRVLRTF